eukprot:11011345-Alexandrium_andersonii.AAC.1
MSASLVGSEMCIRDRMSAVAPPSPRRDGSRRSRRHSSSGGRSSRKVRDNELGCTKHPMLGPPMAPDDF